MIRIGISMSSLGLSIRPALAAIADLAIGGVQFEATGELAPGKLTDTGRREFKNLLKMYDLRVTALNCPFRNGIDAFELQQQRLDHLCAVMSLAFELGPKLVVVAMPRLPRDDEPERAGRLKEALERVGSHGDRIGCSVALEIGLDPAEKVREYLNGFDCGSLGVHYDPANMVVHGHDPVKSLLPLAGKILHVQARDVRSGSVGQTGEEVALGQGSVPWLNFAATLAAVEYREWLTIRRDPARAAEGELKESAAFLRRIIF